LPPHLPHLDLTPVLQIVGLPGVRRAGILTPWLKLIPLQHEDLMPHYAAGVQQAAATASGIAIGRRTTTLITKRADEEAIAINVLLVLIKADRNEMLDFGSLPIKGEIRLVAQTKGTGKAELPPQTGKILAIAVEIRCGLRFVPSDH